MPRPGDAADFILTTDGLTKEFAGFVAVRNVDLRIRRGTIHALIGPNGAGKSTCFNLLTKFIEPSSGTIIYNGRDITGSPPAEIARLGLVRSFQISAVFPHLSVLENVRIAVQREARRLLRLLAPGNGAATPQRALRALLDAVGPRRFAACRRRPALRPQARPRNCHHARARAGNDAARRADLRHDAGGRPAHRRFDQPGWRRPHCADGRAQSVGRRDLSDRITVLARGEVLAEGNYAQCRAIRASSKPISEPALCLTRARGAGPARLVRRDRTCCTASTLTSAGRTRHLAWP